MISYWSYPRYIHPNFISHFRLSMRTIILFTETAIVGISGKNSEGKEMASAKRVLRGMHLIFMVPRADSYFMIF
jgi:hypothetical protein